MKTIFQKALYSYFSLITAIAWLYPVNALAVVSTHTMAEFTSFPMLTTDSASVTPMVMINSSNDHQLFFKVYNDYSDLDNDGEAETTYKHTIDYYGYFDSYKCYEYDQTEAISGHGSGLFEPVSVTADKYCSAAGTPATTWSGNFLNWVTMSRIDAVRKILFGGHRRVDSATETVLERSFIPTDAHSWAKYYNGADVHQLTPFDVPEITMCNTTKSAATYSQDATEPPLMRLAEGNYSLWASNEQWQCRWRNEVNVTNGNAPADSGLAAESRSPFYADSLNNGGSSNGDFSVRIQACVTGLIGNENCKLYPGADGTTGNGDDVYKPIGLYQTYGDDDRLWFGMMAGSYSKNKSGGTLVKDVGTLTDEINVATDGTFSQVGLYASVDGVANNRAWGIINAMSIYRIIDYEYGVGNYNRNSRDDCPWGLASFPSGDCKNWGNPFGEIYLNSLRYFAGETVSGDFRANDSNLIQALQTPQTFNCPLDESNYCARLNIINFNSSVISYDSDQLDDVSDGIGSIGSSLTSTELTTLVGDGESITGNDYFIGELIGGSGTDINQLCTTKTIADLGNVLGLCPEAPRLGGSYRIAGMAHWAHTNDIRSSGPNELQGDQSVDTYSVALASTVPSVDIAIPNSSETIKLLPACHNQSIGGACAIVDFKVVTPYTLDNGPDSVSGTGDDYATGRYYVNWEDSEQGGDYDTDMWGIIDYKITTAGLVITTDVLYELNAYKLGFGYIIRGTTTDGMHVHSGVDGYDLDGCSVTPCTDGSGGSADPATSRSFTFGPSTAELLEDPLYYAAKWGGFTDSNSNGTPDVQSEWDKKINASGISGQDGIPDNFFYATNPVELEAALVRVFDDILSKTASGTAAAVVANSREGIGAIYQAVFTTSKDVKNLDSTTDSVKWYGQLHSLWIDSFGFMREDSNGNAVLDDYNTDLVIDMAFSEIDRKTTISRFGSCSDSAFVLDDGDGCIIAPSINNSMDTIKPIWNARKQLSGVSDFTTQRSYSDLASGKRYIRTWIDANNNNVVDAGEMVDFDASTIDSTNFGFFDVAADTDADKVVNFIRGEAVGGFRNRLADVDGDGTKEQLVLGDIVNSTPTPVASPAEAFDLLYNDSSYKEFRAKYRNRRTVVYAGANDGLLHAFNGGFYDKASTSFETSRATDASEIPSSTTTVAHPLGTELWAYAPMNLLPHLKWLTRTDYSHVYYMDAKPRVFDAKIFADDANHPGGWGTVIVAGMRFGGGAMTIDTAADGFAAASDDVTMRSGYVVMDITNPEDPPVLLAEITHPDIGFTTSYPTAFTISDGAAATPNKWHLVFGSGPTNLSTAESTQNGRLYIYDLVAKDFVTGYPVTIGEANSFIGDPVSVDWDLSYKSDALYFGTIAGTSAAPTGKMYKMKINKDPDPANWGTPEVFYNSGQPSLPTPTVAVDSREDHWLFWGTGRLLVDDDLTSTPKQYIYGLKDVEDNNGDLLATYSWDLVDVSSEGLTFSDADSDGVLDTVTCDLTAGGCVQVLSDGSLSGVADFDIDGDAADDTVDTFAKLSSGMLQKDGWKKGLPSDGTNPSTRVLSTSALIGEVLFSSAYEPGVNLCDSLGNSDLYAVFFGTGTALPPSVLGVVDTDGDPDTADVVIDHLDIGHGISSSPSVHTGEGVGDSGVTVVTQTGVGAIDQREAQVKGGVRSGEMSWRQLYQ